MSIARSELKNWAREHLRGLENCLLPSFTPDLSGLDEEGIRWDLQQSITHGFSSTLCCAESGLTFEEAKRFVSIVADEAKDRISVSVTIMFDSFDQNFEMLRHADKAGCHTALIGYPPSYWPRSEEEILHITKKMSDAANLAIVLYPSHKFNFERFHPSGFSPDLLNRMADIENAVAMKVGVPDLGYIAQCFELCSDRILVNAPIPMMLPMMVQKYGQQWAGAIPYEFFQSPEKPYLVECFNLLLTGKTQEAMDIYWRLAPVMNVFQAQQLPIAMLGTYHWPLWKYYQWLVGGNGGYTRQPVMKLYQRDMEMARNALRAIGIAPRENDEEFYVGRCAYAKGKRP